MSGKHAQDEPNTFMEVSEMGRQLALSMHTSDTVSRARAALQRDGVPAALKIIEQGAPRFVRLGGTK